VSTALLQVTAAAARLGDGKIALAFELNGALDEVRVQPPAASVHTDALWKHTCFEAFVRVGGEAYFEFNIAPSGAWAAYQFDGYRQGMKRLAVTTPQIIVKRKTNLLAVHARFEAPDVSHTSNWRVALSSVIEETNGDLTYWALAHPPGKPDFHHIDGFTLNLPADLAA
jgi:hypothetical protein